MRQNTYNTAMYGLHAPGWAQVDFGDILVAQQNADCAKTNQFTKRNKKHKTLEISGELCYNGTYKKIIWRYSL
jgi:hypothetical protein